MKLSLLKYIIPAVILTWFLSSCSDDVNVNDIENNQETGEYVDVTFQVSADTGIMDMEVFGNSQVASRSESSSHGPGSAQEYIGKGREIDMLVIAVYDDKGTLLTQYGEVNQYGLLDIDGNPISPEEYAAEGIDVENENIALKDLVANHRGHTVVYAKEFVDNEFELTLRLMRDKNYHIAFWAQSSKTAAYDTKDLERVIVSYDNALNNDENRDAFCKVESFSVSANTSKAVALKRPFAQINVGATNKKKEALGDVKYSKAELAGVANCIDIVSNEISSTNGFNGKAVFNWNEMPKDEMLKVDVDNEGNIEDYWDFHYLSMCYALVPDNSETDEDVSWNTELSEVKVFFSDKNYEVRTEGVETTKVPVQRNWRTNFLGGVNKDRKKLPVPIISDMTFPDYVTEKIPISVSPLVGYVYGKDYEYILEAVDREWPLKFSEDGKYVCEIPIDYFPQAEIKLSSQPFVPSLTPYRIKSKSINKEELASSEYAVATIELTAADWNFNSPDIYNIYEPLIEKWTKNASNTWVYPDGLLTLNQGGKNVSKVTQNGVHGIHLDNTGGINASNFNFKIYRACQVKIRASVNSAGKERIIIVNGGSRGELTQNMNPEISTSTYYTFNLQDDDKGEIYIYNTGTDGGGDVNYFRIQLTKVP